MLSLFKELCRVFTLSSKKSLEPGEALIIQGPVGMVFGAKRPVDPPGEIQEAHTITDMAFWKPDPDNPRNVIREKSVRELPEEHSEWPMMLITQVRIIDHFNRFMKNAPTRMEPDYGYEFVDFVESDDPGAEYPLTVTLRRSAGPNAGEEL